MILESLEIDRASFEARTGWSIKPQGACKGEMCVPLPGDPGSPTLDARVLAERMGMPLVHDERHGLWALGPETMGRALASAESPAIVLPDRNGEPFDLSSLRGQKVMLLAWASW